AALKFQPDPGRMPGIDRIQLLCDELDNADGLSAANVAKIRAKVCRAKPCSLEAANLLSLNEAADALEAQRSSAGNADNANRGLRGQADAMEKRKEPAPAVTTEPSRTGFLGGADLADALGVHPSQRDAFFKQLERKRTSLGDECWQEVRNAR